MRKNVIVKTILATVFAFAFLWLAIPAEDVHASYTGMIYWDNQWRYMKNDAIDWNYTGMANNEYGWFYFKNGVLDWNYNGMANNEYGWWYYRNGVLDWNYTGMANNEYGWWYYKNGQLDWNYTGMANNEYGWWYYQNGRLDWNYTGMANNEYGWFYYVNGRMDFTYRGMGCNEWGWWYFIDSTLIPQYTGVGINEYGKWYYQNGQIDFNYSKMTWLDGYGWKFVRNGQVDEHYTGLATNEYGTWYFSDGTIVDIDTGAQSAFTGMATDENGRWYYLKNAVIDPDYTGMAENEYGWWYFKNGQLDWNYTGIGRNPWGSWFYRNGRIAFDYTGQYTDGNVTYTITQGAAVANESRNLLLGVFYNSREDTSNTLYVSFDGYTFYSLGEAYSDADRYGDETQPLADLATVSPSIVLQPSDGDYYTYYNTMNVFCPRDTNIFYKDGYFWLAGTARGTEANNKKMVPSFAFSKDLVNWSYMLLGTDNDAGINYNVEMDKWLEPSQLPPASNTAGGYDAVAGDTLVDDDGTIWYVVSTGCYTDDHGNRLAPYLIKVTDLSVINDNVTSIYDKIDNSNFNVKYGPMVAINLPLDKYNIDKYWDHGDCDYDGSLYKKDGVYYFVVQHSGEVVHLWRINDLNNASNPDAWTLVNQNVIYGSEGPCIVEFNGTTIIYSDRYVNWNHYDMWGDDFGMIASTADSLVNGGKEYEETERLFLKDANGKSIPARHGKVIALHDDAAINIVLNRYHSMGY